MSDAAVRSYLIVLLATDSGGAPGLVQRLEPLLVQALVAESPVEALDVAVLHRPSRLDQDVLDAMAVRPGHECPACEFPAVVGANGQWVAAEERCPIEQSGDVLARDAPVGARHVLNAPVDKASARPGDLDDLAREIAGHLVGLGWMAVTVAGEPHKAAGAALAQLVLEHQSADRLGLGLWG